VPPGGLLLAGLCPRCDQRLVVLDADIGVLRPLTAQPPLGTGLVRALDQRGDTIWVVSGGSEPAVTAVSTDRGRSWRSVPAPVTAADGLRLSTDPDGGAYLIGTRQDEQGNDRLAGIWRVTDPAGGWRQIRPADGPRSVRSSLVGSRGLLVLDGSGYGWRLGPTGEFVRLPDPDPLRPGWIISGPGRLLVGVPRGTVADRIVLTSSDEGDSWQVERIPA